MDSNSAPVVSAGCCPACKKKGLIKCLKTYRISFEESIFLCENPQCIYPLGFESLSNIVIPIDARGYPREKAFRKRVFFDTKPESSTTEPNPKLTRTDNADQISRPGLALECNGTNLSATQSGQVDFSQASPSNIFSAAESTEPQMDMELATEENLSEVSLRQTHCLSEYDGGSSESRLLIQDKQPGQRKLWLQWRNAHALCWLDCVLSATVHLETLRTVSIGWASEDVSVIQKLFAKYNQATALVNNCLMDKNILKVPSDVLSKAESYLNEVRNIIFSQLQSQLKCKLGEEESPVFAFPLLLQKDPRINKLFLYSFSWHFECLQCGYQFSDRCQKVLTTFTNVIPEWHPLNAVHIAPCNNCSHRSQRRRMVLEDVPSVLMMHFVDGLPHSDLAAYSFQFQGCYYPIKAVVQYQESKKHFITWVLNSDETWLESDDLKGSYCKRHKRFGVPPAEVHLVIWERKSPQMANKKDLQLHNEITMNVPSPKATETSPVKCFKDKSMENPSLIRHSLSNVHPYETETFHTNNRSNLLLGLENLASDDVITLNLVCVPLDSEGKPLEDRPIVPNYLPSSGHCNVLPCSPEGDISGNECTLLEPSSAPLCQGQPSNASTISIVSTVPANSNNYSPETSSVHTAGPEFNVLQVKDSSLDLVNPQNEVFKTKPGDNRQRIPDVLQPVRDTPTDFQASGPGGCLQSGQKKGTKLPVASWVKGLLGKHPPFLPKSVSASNKVESYERKVMNVQKERISTSLGRHAGQFRGFQAKCLKSTTKEMTKLGSSSKTPVASLFANSSVEKCVLDGNAGAVTKRSDLLLASSKQIPPFRSRNKNTASFDRGEAPVDNAHQLRLKLLQDLKAKKEKLASLDKLAKTQAKKKTSSKKTKKDQPRTQKESDSLQSLLKDLEHQIDVEYSKSMNSPLTSTSQCSSSSYDDILSELLSPATTVASLEPSPEEECRYMEMGGGSPESAVLDAKLDAALDIDHDHNYTTPEKENGCDGHTDPLTVKSSLKKLDFESPTKQDILDDFLPSSVLNSIIADTEDLHHFDESLLAW